MLALGFDMVTESGMRKALTDRLKNKIEENGYTLSTGFVGTGIISTVLSSLGLEIPLFGMVKDDYHKTRALTDGERELSIALDHGVYTFIYKLQEEAHRFAVKGTMASKTKTLTHSSLEKIEGIGHAKAKKLLAAMSLSEIRVASEEKLSSIAGISAENAHAIATYYKTKKTGEKKK